MKTLIVGGGLSGLALAQALEAQGDEYLLLEARSRFGGRILTHNDGDGYFDMGPAWFWRGQPRIAALIERLNLQEFDQFADGVLTFEDENGHVQRGKGFSSMEGSLRLTGGLVTLTDTLADGIPDDRKRLNAEVTQLEKNGNHCVATLSNGENIKSDRVVLALPPRVAAQIKFLPALPTAAMQTMQGVPTWMAAQAKAVAVYDRPFWREDGLSGDAMSRRGPMVEIHDASPAKGGPYALFGFIGIPPHARTDEHALRQHLQAQLIRLFGPQAAEPRQLYIKDWAFDPYTATEVDKAPLYEHPTYGLPTVIANIWDNKLYFAGTEVAPVFGGYLEGALEAAENVLQSLSL
jgi:monoamine oxidase